MTSEERFTYDLLEAEFQRTEDEEQFMYELLEEEADFDEEFEEESGYSIEYDEIESKYELDPTFPDDDWLEAGEEWELAPDYGED